MTSDLLRSSGWLVFASACAWGGGPGPGPQLNTTQQDAAPPADAPTPRDTASADAPAMNDAAMDAPVMLDAPPSGEHLLLTEIALAPGGSEFIEIFNPTTQAIDLSHYYVSNHGSYFKLPAGAPPLPSAHFIVQFKAGSTIAAGAVVTLATQSASSFHTAYGVNPTYSIADGTVTSTDVVGTPSLTDTGTIVTLFEWDGTSALVKDVDMMIAGAPTATSALMSKSGYAQNGSTYATDANTIAAQSATPGAGKSTKRIAAEAGQEIQAGTGNGITGHDETSEHTNVTWDATFTAPTPGQVPAGL